MTLASAQAVSIKRESLGLSTPYEAPKGEMELAVAKLFAEVFELDRVGANDDFFDVGGDSLMAEALSHAISRQTGYDFQLSSLVDHSTPRKVAALLEQNLAASATPAASPGERDRPPIFVVHGRDGLTFPRGTFLRALAKGQGLHMFELPGIRGGPSHDRVEDIAAVYIQQIQETYPKGPVLLAAFCMGGLIALEMAAQLAARRRPVRQLVLLDPGLPKSTRADKHGVGSEWPPRETRWDRLRARLRRRLGLRAAQRRTAQQRLAFDNDVREFQRRFERKEQQGRQKYPGVKRSVEAQARLQAAFRQHRPPPFHGAAAILSSEERDATFRDPSNIWHEFLPNLEVRPVVDEHGQIGGAASARLMQSIFDAAIAEDRVGGRLSA